MLKEKRINYALGLIFCILIFGFMAAPYFGEASCYEILDVFKIMQTIGEKNPLISATYAFTVLTITSTCIVAALAIAGFTLHCTPFKLSKVENIISIIYSSMLFVLIATADTMIILSILWLVKAELTVKYGLIVIFAIVYLFPYFCATKFNLAFVIFSIICYSYTGFLLLLLHEKVFKPRYLKPVQKKTISPEE